ncbi:Antiviral helicase ski2 [Saitoella coloradoensis]
MSLYDIAKEARNLRPQTTDELIGELERTFLTPECEFSEEWLNKLQERNARKLDYDSVYALPTTVSRTSIRFTREGLEGRITGYQEVTIPSTDINAKNSTSILRKPAARTDFVRGRSGFVPFLPGGLEDGTIDGEEKHDEVSPKGLLQVAPGLSRGLRATKHDDLNEVDEVGETNPDVWKLGEVKPIRREIAAVENAKKQNPSISEEADGLDDLLPTDFPLLASTVDSARSSTGRPKGREWAHVVDVNQELTNFHDLVPDMAKKYSFELDTFQKEAVYHLEQGDSVFVAAHTSAGKTVVAEYAIALAAKHMTRAIYTSPIKALSNQKFRDFKNTFEDVGILTGDVQINPEASCLIMTTEILRSMLYRGADIIRDVEYVIFDEVHYVNDLERGVVWEEVIIMLPEHVSLILLSATVPNTKEFASWVGRTKKKDIYVISTPKRPVPLEHFLWANKGLHKIVDANKNFLMQGWKDANAALTKTKEPRPTAPGQTPAQRGGRGAARGGGQVQRGASNFSRGRGGMRTMERQDTNIFMHLVNYLKKEKLLPVVVFVFSKRRCEDNANSIRNVDLCTASEKSEIHVTIEKSIARLKAEDRVLPQIRRMRDLLSRGIAVHHGGLLPIVKEIVELLFARGLVKVLFATETFAMGVNMPAKCVVFSGIRKHDGRSFRDLLPGEYTQMAGRAGRRGLDTTGTVIIIAQSDDVPDTATLSKMINGAATKLTSQFRLTYNMILNLLRVEALRIEEMIKRSFSENASQVLLPEHQKKVLATEEDLKKLVRVECDICGDGLRKCHEAAMDYRQLTRIMLDKAMVNVAGRRILSTGRLVVIQDKETTRMPAILISEVAATSDVTKTYYILRPRVEDTQKQPADLLPFLPLFKDFIKENFVVKGPLKLAAVPATAIEFVTGTTIKVDANLARRQDKTTLQSAADELSNVAVDVFSPSYEEADWSKVKDLTFVEIRNSRHASAIAAQQQACLDCPEFLKHYAMEQQEYLLRSNITQLKQLISDQNLELLPDYEQRIAVLKELHFIDEDLTVQLKGRVACEVNSTNALILTELVLENTLAEFEPEEIVALLSSFVFQERSDAEPKVTPHLEKGKDIIMSIAARVNAVQEKHQVLLAGEDSEFTDKKFGLMEVVYEWARGMSFNTITELTDVLEGTIVRAITRLDETCREVKNAARLIGDAALFTRMEECQELIKRDIIFAPSLYM